MGEFPNQAIEQASRIEVSSDTVQEEQHLDIEIVIRGVARRKQDSIKAVAIDGCRTH
jgi:hypothetical protein